MFTSNVKMVLPCSSKFPIDIPTSKPYEEMPTCTAKHSYLLKNLSCITDYNPRLIARVIDKEMSFHTTYRNLEPPFLKLASSHPIIYSPQVDGTRAKIAFGNWALPKLKRELHNRDILVVMKALNSLHDLVHNPEKAFDAIKIGVIDRLTDMMLHERDFVREKVCMIFFTLGHLEQGKRAIIQRYKILNNLALLIEDEVDAVRHKAQIALEILTLSPIAAAGLHFADFTFLLLRLIGGTPKTEDEEILSLHLATLKILLNKDIAQLSLEFNAMNILIDKIEHQNEKIRCLALDCLAFLCQNPKGRAEAVEKNLGFLLCKKLFDPSIDVKIKATGVLAFVTIESEVRKKLSKKCTVDNLIQVLENFHNSEGQLMAAKTLTNLSEDPDGKSLVKKEKGKIKAIFTNKNEDVERHKKILLNMLKKN